MIWKKCSYNNNDLRKLSPCLTQEGSFICICNKSQTHTKGKLVSQFVYRKLCVHHIQKKGWKKGREGSCIFWQNSEKLRSAQVLILDFTRNLAHRLDHNMCKYQQWYISSEKRRVNVKITCLKYFKDYGIITLAICFAWLFISKL